MSSSCCPRFGWGSARPCTPSCRTSRASSTGCSPMTASCSRSARTPYAQRWTACGQRNMPDTPPCSGQRQEHHVQPDVPVLTVPERARHGADDLEAERLPEAYGGGVRLDDGVETDAAEPLLAVPAHDMLPEGPSDAATTRVRRHHEARGADVRPAARPVRAHLGGAEHPAVLGRDH